MKKQPQIVCEPVKLWEPFSKYFLKITSFEFIIKMLSVNPPYQWLLFILEKFRDSHMNGTSFPLEENVENGVNWSLIIVELLKKLNFKWNFGCHLLRSNH